MPPARLVFPLKVVANLRPARGEETELVAILLKPESVVVIPVDIESVVIAEERPVPELKSTSFEAEDASNVA